MRKAEVFYQDIVAGILIKPMTANTFEYKADYIANYPEQFITCSMPVVNSTYETQTYCQIKSQPSQQNFN